MRELSDILKVEFVTLSVVLESRSETISPKFHHLSLPNDLSTVIVVHMY